MDIDSSVLKSVNKYGTNDPFMITKKMGIFLFFADLGDTFGFYNCANRIKMININDTINDIMKRFVCAHELAHAILHPYLNVPYMRRQTLFSIDKIECEANRFATKLLTFETDYESWMTKENYLKVCGIPPEMARFI
ncbi:ImmA/IrrE family metallo-endopeptidase [Sporolactobacillus sp. CQH2019]|uniref:ImmA/IrrE family metallo-endopeptidase n=1 Tax=Sporolactobacillus sp. CQH2019 TaxID=3023512 RepID=UPI002367F6B5|nr:ImmA/IrrE family metallo-endopeptidase [Sporolactobacillus sp. CQH2019]MDD9147860.1 ImmA/IrrE family metallo-endopeptidase [Sporolactobacillus sp. CQH2019]